MVRKQHVAAAVRRALVMGAVTAAGVAAPAHAQESMDEIVVTGSRIRLANLESTTPVTQVTAADVVTQGVTRIEDLVNQLPQAFAAQNVTVSQRRDRHGDPGPARPRLAAHARPDRRPAHALRRRHAGVRGAGHQPDPDADDRARRRPDRRRFGGLRLRCRRRRRQLHHEEGLRGRSGHVPVQLLLARERLRRPRRRQAARHDRGLEGKQSFAVRPARRQRDRRRRQGAVADGRRQQWRRPRQHHGLRHGVSTASRCCSATATTRPAR